MHRAGELVAAAQPFALATVVRVDPPSSASAGNRAIVRPDGGIEGWLGGGCVTPTVRSEALAAIATGESRLVRITPNVRDAAPANVIVKPMACGSGGTIDVWIEPFLAPPVLAIGGASPVGGALATLGVSLGFRTIVYSGENGDPIGGVEAIASALEERVAKTPRDVWLVAASHGDFDDDFCEAGLRLGYRYVGLIASTKRARIIEVHLRRRGFADEALAAFHPAAGLRIGAKTPEEIALSVLAEIVSLRRAEAPIEPEAHALPAAVARDPVCGMEVDQGSAEHSFELDGRTWYFCCSGCRNAFERDPSAYAAAP
jgi:xanthine dehydrogenase accessory factor